MRYALAPGFFQEMMYRGAVLEPEAALERRLVDAIAAPDRLMERALEVAHELASMPPPAFAITKRQMREPAWERMKTGRLGHDPGVLDVWKAPGTLEAVKAYVSRTIKRAGS
jgi:enoyl-CoA hydratase